MMQVRQPAVAGSFYPAEAGVLRARVEVLLAEHPDPGPVPKALIVPHAGYLYSGSIAASAYALLRGRAGIRRVVLLGPAHRYPVSGMALPAAELLSTPLGLVPVDLAARELLVQHHGVRISDAAHALEHSLEVQLPFLQVCLGEFRCVPLIVGEAAPEQVARALDAVWGGDETLIVVSSDLSHYHDDLTARRLDAATGAAIVARETSLTGEQACGCRPLNGLMRYARDHGLRVVELDRRNSGDTAGGRDRVVGYGAFALYPEAPA